MSIKADTAFLLSLYTKNELSFPSLYGEKSLAYMCQISATYARVTMPEELVASDPECVTTMALWMMIGWPIDNVFDKCRSFTTDADVAKLLALLDLSPSHEQVGPAVISHPLLASLIESTKVLYKVYLERVKPYLEKAPEAWNLHKQWFCRYIQTVRDNREIPTIKEFAEFRLPGGGIMCQFAQTMLFMGKTPVETDMALWTKTALVVAYFNDLVSVARDLEQSTPNVVTVRMAETGEKLWEAINWADKMIVRLEKELDDECKATQSEAYVGKVIRSAVKNSRDWHISEARYARDVSLVLACRRNDREMFDAIYQEVNKIKVSPKLQVEASTLGDPIAIH